MPFTRCGKCGQPNPCTCARQSPKKPPKDPPADQPKDPKK